MKTKKQKLREFIVGLVFSFIASVVIAMKMKMEQTGKAIVPETYLVTFILFTLCILLMFLMSYFLKYFDKLNPRQTFRRLIPAMILFYGISLILAYLCISTGVFVWYIIQGHDLSQFIHNLFAYELKGVHNGMFKWMIVGTMIIFFIMWQNAVKKQQKLEEEKLKYQYKTLKSQVSPHFLFNSLNTLSSLITSNPEAAEQFTDKLAGIYRYIVDNENTSLISLSEELTFVRQYFDLQSIRDEGKIILDIDVRNADKYQILPVSLQTLIENAFKHNINTKDQPLHIKIYREDKQITVENNLQEKNSVNGNGGTGLENLKERVKLETGKEIIIEKTKHQFKVTIPLNEI